MFARWVCGQSGPDHAEIRLRSSPDGELLAELRVPRLGPGPPRQTRCARTRPTLPESTALTCGVTAISPSIPTRSRTERTAAHAEDDPSTSTPRTTRTATSSNAHIKNWRGLAARDDTHSSTEVESSSHQSGSSHLRVSVWCGVEGRGLAMMEVLTRPSGRPRHGSRYFPFP
jgi:hypothetical protein